VSMIFRRCYFTVGTTVPATSVRQRHPQRLLN
jgi:hypothetical protein